MRISPSKLRFLICLILATTRAAAQNNGAQINGTEVNNLASACSRPEIVLQRYVDAVGGKAVYDIQSRAMTAKVSTISGSVTEHEVYKFKWKAPNKLTAGSNPYLLNLLPVSYPNGTFIFDGRDWSNGDGRISRNEDRDPPWQRTLRHKYPYNESPNFLMFRVVADPLLLIRANEWYSSFEADTNFSEHPGLCMLRANGLDEWRYQRQDLLYFDAASGLLKTWKIQAGLPPHKTYVQFQFDDYRRVGAIKFPFYLYFDFYKATFRYTEVDNNRPVADSDFVAKPAKP